MSIKRKVEMKLEQQRNQKENRGRLLVKCPDKPGIVSTLSTFLLNHDSNIIESSQYSNDPENGTFFIRMEFHCENLMKKAEQIEIDFEAIAATHSMDYHFAYESERKKTAIFVSKEPHCLMELL